MEDNQLHSLGLKSRTWSKIQTQGSSPVPRMYFNLLWKFYIQWDLNYLNTLQRFTLRQVKNTPKMKTRSDAKRRHSSCILGVFFAKKCKKKKNFSNHRHHTFDLIGNRVFTFAGKTQSEVTDLYILDVNQKRWQRPLYEGQVLDSYWRIKIIGAFFLCGGTVGSEFLTHRLENVKALILTYFGTGLQPYQSIQLRGLTYLFIAATTS